MAYNGVSEPRFYIDEIQYLQSIGFDFKQYYLDNYRYEHADADYVEGLVGINREQYMYLPNIFQLTPHNQTNLNIRYSQDPYSGSFLTEKFLDIPAIFSNIEGDNIGRYVGILNHRLNYEYTYNGLSGHSGNDTEINNLGIAFKWLHPYYDTQVEQESMTSDARLGAKGVLNYDESGLFPINNDGSSIAIFEPSAENFNPEKRAFHRVCLYKDWRDPDVQAGESTWEEFGFGALSLGIYYDLRSPDLDIEMTTEFDGFSSTRTLGGSTLTNVRYSGAPYWYDILGNKREPFQIGGSNPLSKRNGRRIWNLKFSYLADTDVFASNYMSNKYYEDSSSVSINDIYKDAGDKSDDGNYFRYTLEEDNSFMAQVINRIGNGQKFIFQPDKNNNNPDQFAICVLDDDEFSIKQVAYRTYEFSLKIREVW